MTSQHLHFLVHPDKTRERVLPLLFIPNFTRRIVRSSVYYIYNISHSKGNSRHKSRDTSRFSTLLHKPLSRLLKFCHITAIIIKSFYWLKINDCIEYRPEPTRSVSNFS